MNYTGLLDFPICAVHDEGFIVNPYLKLRRPATTSSLDQTRLSLPARLPIQAINYHPNHINPPLQNHKINQIDAQKQYRRFPLSMRERADPSFGMSKCKKFKKEQNITLMHALPYTKSSLSHSGGWVNKLTFI